MFFLVQYGTQGFHWLSTLSISAILMTWTSWICSIPSMPSPAKCSAAANFQKIKLRVDFSRFVHVASWKWSVSRITVRTS